tara:strand:- start:670 stop:873 length:204 start_codon:yes stop_codon:yes gene_type:complete
MKISIDTLSNKKITIDIEKEDTIKDIKKKIEKMEGLNSNKIDFFSNNEKLKDKYKITNKCNIFMKLK